MREIIVVGAGAAGLFAAGTLLEQGCKNVTLMEQMDAPGKKLAITGKGRCNLTNNCDLETFLKNIRTNPRFLYSAASALPPAAVMDLFEHKLGVPLKTERGRRVFPVSDAAGDIVQALVRRAKDAKMLRGKAVELLIEDGEGSPRAAGVRLEDGRAIAADAVLVATGGVSYPVTGSTGIGYKLARQAGHTVVPPQPSLVSLVAKDAATCRRMAGLSLRNVGLTLLQDGKAVYNELGEMLFTHFGLSGPMVLSASAYIGDMAKHKYTVSIDLKPALDAEKLDARLQRDFAELANRDTANALDKLLPASLRPVMLERWGADPQRKANQITKAERRRLGELTKDFRIEIKNRGDLDHAVITSGGVAVKEVDPKTMQSKKLPGLYFAGEVLDVDGYTGGYNLQVAWCTAFAAAVAMSKGE
ncbi:NAD(P)/FAD-dependent oxidoreductase [Ruminococcaceae bacterium OttesenSCG-928-D13]|nr:NAD(P)/FAD-dependent oxidoreductase [Ruminococcaceae bacterium OttesenSCG-928-D13]